MAKGKTGAKKSKKVERRDDEPAVAADADGNSMYAHRIIEAYRALWLPDGLSEDQKSDRMAAVLITLDGIKPRGRIPPRAIYPCKITLGNLVRIQQRRYNDDVLRAKAGLLDFDIRFLRWPSDSSPLF